MRQSGRSTDVDSLATGLARDRFPLLARTIGDRPLHYLDTAATSQKPEAVLAALAHFYRHQNANVHRGLNTLAEEATEAYERCRRRVAGWVGAPDAAGVVITRGATSSLNLLAHGLEHLLLPGDEILLTEMEHHANLVPWQMLARRRGLQLRFIPVRDDGELDLDRLPELLGERTRVVSLVHASNVLGTVNPVAEVADRSRQRGILTVVDAAQSAGHLPLDFAAVGADFLVFSAHKAYGPMGLGFLVARPEALERLEPLEGGGEMIEWVDLESSTWAEVPRRFEAGTPNVAAAAAFPAAIDLIEELGAPAIRRHEAAVTAYALDCLQDLGGLTIYGPADSERRGGLVSFWDPLVHPHDLSTILDRHGVVVRAGHHCAQPLHRRLGVPATTRASFGLYTRRDDIDALIEGIRDARKVFAR
ncbi:MAG TPA: SufS family cysteine desulfurase [Candidatus Krumholzibacteria bacterium]|nr:SufS family cysteine desulfurase [Candidatus Krumholzibacteria bacterium]HPD71176.1 SufS family cysteine desulfurase [Candidatus Krumholzibacteria bacterium]HRY39124.1 SufS family cysteine desulfurase [Candidatus Krumholzibacteria bacterium]